MGHIALVKTAEVRQQFSPFGEVLVGTQHSAGKTAALHLAELVHQHVAGGADVALETAAATQHQRLAEGAAIAERGEMQLNGVHAVQGCGHGVRIVRQLQISCFQGVCGGV